MMLPDQSPPKRSNFWTTRAKWAGNIAPCLVGLPFLIPGVIIALAQHRVGGAALILVSLGVFMPALCLNWLAMVGNNTLKSDFFARHSRAFVRESDEASFFCGVANSAVSGLLDPHQDIGYLCIGAESIRFFGEVQRLDIKLAAIKGLGWKSNPHSLLGLGGFAKVEWQTSGKPETLLFESREYPSLLANKRHTLATLRSLQSKRERLNPGPK